MPKLNDETMEQINNIGTYGFSAVKIDELGASEYCLCTICVDCSGSVWQFKTQMESVLKEVVKACQLSPRADNLMIRVVRFNDDVDEVHGFKLLENIKLDDYNDCLPCGGATRLFDTVFNAVEATTAYAKNLKGSDYLCNSITVVITDGMDNRSSFGYDRVASSLHDAVISEALESMVSILVGVNITDPVVSNSLNDFNTKSKFTQYVELDNASAKTLAKLAEFVSKSVSAQSQALATGGPSKSLSF